ncbi:hypothetical protein GV819_21235 [Pseudomonas sp. Fl5BN2]|uniref:hypothetical protein n=1 Tax=unclassified Pseudomonas TaxID=196821 RepID=UPI0013775729|nr:MULTISPECIES: hypothetical protein [unclassified Pseudomonas]NBF04813.1 hypothetical protein [Pseudomonas sp. Fl5BN2]NBF10250.1 hypothetical protein [Pseudomonas sp. Fl4BN1]
MPDWISTPSCGTIRRLQNTDATDRTQLIPSGSKDAPMPRHTHASACECQP